ncbi:MAG: hypothetical protein ACKOD9_16310 [Rubrivivax sp.]
MTQDPLITGWGHTPFGKLDAVDLEQLIRDAALPALDNAGLAPEEIDGIKLAKGRVAPAGDEGVLCHGWPR